MTVSLPLGLHAMVGLTVERVVQHASYSADDRQDDEITIFEEVHRQQWSIKRHVDLWTSQVSQCLRELSSNTQYIP